MIKYPTVDLLVLANKRVIEETKVTKAEKHGLLTNKKVLEGIISEMKGAKGDIFDKAAVLLVGLIQKHPFESGNRRTAFLETINFLEVNKVKINIDKGKLLNVLQGIRERFYTLDEISIWLRTGEVHEFKRE